jgi:hypothetical protein
MAEEDLSKRVADLELALAASRAAVPGGTIPEHSGGPGTEVAETWSQQDQELAARGEHPSQQEEPAEEEPAAEEKAG